MDELLLALKSWQANTVVLYSTAQGFHWNVEGALFSQYHDFFGEIYADIYGTIDPIAEYQRKMQAQAPFTLSEMVSLNTYGDVSSPSNSPLIMSQILLLMIEKMIVEVKDLFDLASRSREQGLANFAADRQDKLQEWAWQLRSSIKSITSM